MSHPFRGTNINLYIVTYRLAVCNLNILLTYIIFVFQVTNLKPQRL